MFHKPTNANAIKLLSELESGWLDSFEIANEFLPIRWQDRRTAETPVSRVLAKLEREQNATRTINTAKTRKTELLAQYTNGNTPELTIDEQSRVSRNEEAFYSLLVKWGVYEPITADDLLDV